MWVLFSTKVFLDRLTARGGIRSFLKPKSQQDSLG